jgi:hypothetical protein
MGWVIFGVVIIVLILLVNQGAKIGEENMRKRGEALENRGIDPGELIQVGAYVGGHPDIDDFCSSCVIYSREGKLNICKLEGDLNLPKDLAFICTSDIADIVVEDSSSIERKVTLGRVFLVGVFALAWKKKKKNEVGFITIEWNDGKFNHSTVFSTEGKDALQKVNTVRNKLYRLIVNKENTIEKKPVEDNNKQPVVLSDEDIEKKLRALDSLYEKGLLTKDELESRKREYLEDINTK